MVQMPSQAGKGSTPRGRDAENVRKLDDAKLVEFITGFPCTHFHCKGTLTEGVQMGKLAVVCSACEYVYYHLTSSPP